ncbi:MAG: mycofactocin biosynthesis glycosyltransferase MftF [Rhodospirillales bacterium]|nr:mycofactocin biosynthesis glycosyltransferase MftF [Rhodospirillales bacterium]
MIARAILQERPGNSRAPGALSPGMAEADEAAVTYALQPGLELRPAADGDGGVLFAFRPLMAMRLNRAAFALIEVLSGGGRSAAAAARLAGMAPQEAAGFCDQLARRRLLLRTPAVPTLWPTVSVILAARGRHAATRACVASLLALDYPGGPCEIIVVDDGSEPPLAAALADLPIHLIRLDRNLGQSAARNRGAAVARGNLLAFIDNDCLAEPGWLTALVPHFADPAVAIVGGRIVAPLADGAVAAFEAVRSPLDMGSHGAAVGPDQPVAYLPTCNLVVRREALQGVGGFDAGMRVGEDVDFVWRVLRAGACARYVPSGRVTHYHRTRLPELLQRRADYGSSEADLQRRHPAHRRIMPMPRLCLLLLAALALLPVAWTGSLALAALAGALLAGEVAGKRRRMRRLGLRLPSCRIGVAVLREHVAALHGLSADVIRYSGLPSLAAVFVWPPLAPSAAVLLLAAPLVDHRRLKPGCGLAPFVALYWLEMAAYQLGVWRGCLARRTLRPLLPSLHWKR